MIKKFNNFLLLFISSFLILSAPIQSHAGAWTLKKDRNVWTTSIFLSPSYKDLYNITGYGQKDDADEGNGPFTVTDYYTINIEDRIRRAGLSTELEHGYKDNTTLIGGLNITNYVEKIKMDIDQDVLPLYYYGDQTQSFIFYSDYYLLKTKFGARHRVYKDKFNSVSIEGLIYPGDLIIDDSIKYDDKTLAAKVSLLFGSSFYTPLGIKNRPEYGSYFNIETAYKVYPLQPHHEFEANLIIGMRPLSEKTLFIIGLDNTFHGWNYRKRNFNLRNVNADIKEHYYTMESVTERLKSHFREVAENKTSSSQHLLNFQVGYDFTKSSTLYLKTYHNVFKNKAFKNNAYYLALEVRF